MPSLENWGGRLKSLLWAQATYRLQLGYMYYSETSYALSHDTFRTVCMWSVRCSSCYLGDYLERCKVGGAWWASCNAHHEVVCPHSMQLWRRTGTAAAWNGMENEGGIKTWNGD